ncbi:unnamed protein product [Rotaria sp. Silwood2]
MLEKYGLKYEDPQNHCFLQIVIPPRDQMDNKTIKEVILHDKECPLSSIMFKVVKSSPEYIEIRKLLRAQESALDTIQTPPIQDRTINDHLSMFVEMELIFQHLMYLKFIQIQHTLVVMQKQELANNIFYIDGVGIDRDHCTIHNQNGIVTG